MSKTMTKNNDAASLMLDRAARVLARKRVRGLWKGKTAVLIKETARLRKEWDRRTTRIR